MSCLVLAAACAAEEARRDVAAPIAVPAPAVERPQPAAAAIGQEPSLDLAALNARLRETNAIGLFTKLALKNQVDDLLQQFRAHYLNGQKTSVAALRYARTAIATVYS